MTAEEFVVELAKSAPALEDLLEQGLTQKAARAFRRSLTPKKRAVPGRAPKGAGEVGRLLTSYDCSAIEVGMVRFGAAPARRGGGWEVGLVEADHLVVDSKSGALEVLERGHSTHVLWRCAATGEAFLGALARAAAVLSQRAVGEVPKRALVKHVRECAALAGGDEYEAFFKMLVG
jgi:hypothetical protein